MLAAKMMMAVGAAQEKLYVDDVFSTYLYTGNASTQTINNGIDLAGKGGLVWIKSRSEGTSGHVLFGTNRTSGVNDPFLQTNTAGGQIGGSNNYLTYQSTGFQLNTAGAGINDSGNSLASWTFRNADKFYNHAVVTKTAGSNATVSFPGLGTLGMVRVKRTDAAGSWYVWHRSLSAGQLLIGETTAAAATLGHVTVSGTTVTLVNGVIADGTYLVEAWAHDSGADGIIQCGSFGNILDGEVNLGWEPQFVLVKSSTASGSWAMMDVIRGMTASTTAVTLTKTLYANNASSESDGYFLSPTSTGFRFKGEGTNSQPVYLAIRRPNKPPTSGTKVYNAIARTGTASLADVTGVGFTPDLVLNKSRSTTYRNWTVSRLTGNKSLVTEETSAEYDLSSIWPTDCFTLMDGVKQGIGSSGVNVNGITYINHFFRRAPGFMDVVCYTGTGSATTVAHSLGVAPELMIVRKRSSPGSSWYVWHSSFNISSTSNQYVSLEQTTAKGDTGTSEFWGVALPSSVVFGLGANGNVNGSGASHIAYLFASSPGISKVFSFTGNGSSQNIECGFTTGARFILLRRVDSTGNWLVADSARGIVAGNDPSLALNSTAAEVTTADWVDPYAGGFTVIQEGTNNANVNGATYIGIAIS